LQRAHVGRIVVEPDLSLSGHPEVFVVGDMAYVEQEGQPLPMMAPVAMQEGEYAGNAILKRERGQAAQPFRYVDRGTMAVIGRGAAVARVFGINFKGFLAWLVWLGLHLFMLIGFRNRLIVLLGWAYDYFSYDRKVRLILRDESNVYGRGSDADQQADVMRQEIIAAASDER
jgi:NADH dehydrogenase